MGSSMMRMMLIMCAAAAIVGLLAALPRAEEPAAVVTVLEGTATVFAADAKTGSLLKKNDRLMRNQEVRVGERSRIELRYPDGTVMRFAARSTFKMEDISYNPETRSKTMRVGLGGGKLWANVKKLVTADSKVEVKTVNAVAGVRGTVYRVTVEDDDSVVIKVYDGSVYVSGIPKEVPNPTSPVSGPVPVPGPYGAPPPYHEVTMEEWTVIVKSMQQISISPQGVASTPQDFELLQDRDDWVRWNQERDNDLTL